MRIRNNPEKVGEIFRKNSEDESDIEKKAEATDRRKRRRKRKRHEEKIDGKIELPKNKLTEQDSIITKQRITSKLGIYNKAKRSDTVLRGKNRQKELKKGSEELEEQMKKDLSRVLDCSSFRIQPLRLAGNSDTEMTTDIRPDIQRTSTTTTSECGSVGNLSNCSQSSYGKLGLAFKTPLHEISENLIASLHPSDTFHGRNYLMEVKQQILKVFKQSSANLAAEMKQAGITSDVQLKRCLKRKTEETTPKTEGSTVPLPTHQGSQHDNTRHADRHVSSTNDYKDVIQPRRDEQEPWAINTVHQGYSLSKHSSDIDIQAPHCIDTKTSNFPTKSSHINENGKESYSFDNLELLRSHRGTSCQESSISSCTATSGFDIIDFLDHHTTKNNKLDIDSSDQDVELYDKPIPDISPPKKPSMDTPTPPRFYRRKMY